MKCPLWIINRVKNGKESRFDISSTREGVIDSTHFRLVNFKVKPVLTEPFQCGGRIVAEVEAVDEPYFGGTSAELEISYRCELCGCTISPLELGMPTSAGQLSQLLTDLIERKEQPCMKTEVSSSNE